MVSMWLHPRPLTEVPNHDWSMMYQFGMLEFGLFGFLWEAELTPKVGCHIALSFQNAS